MTRKYNRGSNEWGENKVLREYIKIGRIKRVRENKIHNRKERE